MHARPRPSMPSASLPNKENTSPSKARRKRAASMVALPPSPARKARAPRKSAIRATPQVFESPTSLGPNTEREHIRAPGWSDIAQMVETTTRTSLQGVWEHDAPAHSPGLPNPFAALYRSPTKASPTKASGSMAPLGRPEHTVAVVPTRTSPEHARRQRRVTFSAHQEKTDFEQDEPTMSIRPAQRLVDRGSPVPSSHADTTTSSDEVSMDLTMDSDESMLASDTSATMEMTSAWHAQPEPADASTSAMDMTSESAMDMTGVSAPAWEEDEGEEDASLSMQFTQAYAAAPAPTPTSPSVADDTSMDRTTDSASTMDESAMEMTATWGKFAHAARTSPDRSLSSPRRSPERRQTMLLREEMIAAPTESEAGPVRPATPRAPTPSDAATPRATTPEHRAATPRAITPERRAATPRATTPERRAATPQRAAASPAPLPSTPRSAPPASPRSVPGTTPRSAAQGSPTRFRQSLRGGVPSPHYQHSPARREVPRTPPPGTPVHFATARRASPVRDVVGARASIGVMEGGAASFPRSPFIHSMLRQRGRPSSPVRETVDDSVSDASFHMQLADFLQVVGLKFHEDMTASRSRAERPSELAAAPVSLVDGARLASGAAPMLLTLRNACAELKQHVEDGQLRLKAMEADFYTRPPAFVQEWGQLEDDEMRRSMKGQLHVHKQAARAAAMHDYYGWRTDMQFDEELAQLLARHRDVLRRDAAVVEERRAQLHNTQLPALRARHAALAHQLAAARARQAAIAACDPEELRELHASIEEQGAILQTMRAKHADVAEQLQRVHARLADVETKRAQTHDAIRAARAITDQIRGCSPGEAMRLQRQVEQVERLLAWRITNRTATLLQLTYADALHVTLEIDARRSSVKRVAVSPVRPVEASHLHAAALAMVRAQVKPAAAAASVPAVLRTVARSWSTYRAVRTAITRACAHTPLTVVLAHSETQLALTATVLLARVATKLRVGLTIDLAREAPFVPSSVHAEAVYGDAAYAAPFAARVQSSLEAAPWALHEAFVEARHSLLR
ncbi:hypothetical protein MBRA1_000243 [Malassezia brasiliensis]|uniref:Spc7 kinetochore protein domain-containing protein n=1 Tax=Malassezia brasiliensis TaxID=1821822 RepID=A0AAF0DQM6_9BASI|nr:hypothetical protein MBRA1_000243 [Malassezia brasiliensis]